MAQDPEEALPPYFGISPDEALAELGGPVGTPDLAAIAETCARGRNDLAGRGLEANGTCADHEIAQANVVAQHAA